MITPDIIPAVHIRLEGYSAFFRTAWTISGTQLTVSCPPYSTLLGLISACAGREIMPSDTRIGYEFSRVSQGMELERTTRFRLQGDKLVEHNEGQGVLYREVHFRPKLDLYLTNLDLASVFYNPLSPPRLGRSQDLCWITKVERVELTSVKSGKIGSTMISNKILLNRYISPELVNCTEYFGNQVMGRLRRVKSMGLYQVILPLPSPSNGRQEIKCDNLFHPSNLHDDDVIYLHEWSTN